MIRGSWHRAAGVGAGLDNKAFLKPTELEMVPSNAIRQRMTSCRGRPPAPPMRIRRA